MQHLRINKETNELINKIFEEKKDEYDSKTEIAKTAIVIGLMELGRKSGSNGGCHNPPPLNENTMSENQKEN